jgi:secreted PhoX family phosphatase
MTVYSRTIERRKFLRDVLATAGATAALTSLNSLNLLAAGGRRNAPRGRGGHGPLSPVADLRDGVERISLPEGFQYRTFSPAGAFMSDGRRVPLAHDGMGVFNTRDGKFRLVRNHEDRNNPNLGSIPTGALSYDTRAGGGTTTLVVNPFTRQLERDFISVSGTTVNCAGGVTPWDSWVTCEETNVGPNAAGTSWLRQHGYCFDVPAGANSEVPAVAVPDMGRFSHEALTVDPETWIVYETEDNGDNSGLYRYIANTRGNLAGGGHLQMMAVAGVPEQDTRLLANVGEPLEVTWIDIDNPNPAGTSSTAVFAQGVNRGRVRFRRLEGCWWGNGAMYFVSTNGGPAGSGQVWEYRPNGDDRGTLRLIFVSAGPEELDGPDNLAVSPQGALILCEDGDDEQFMRGVTLDGQIFDFASNLQTDHEWAGATFGEADPAWNDRKIRGINQPLGGRHDRVTLFANRQGSTSGSNPPSAGNEGLTFAIWGPWGDGAL